MGDLDNEFMGNFEELHALLPAMKESINAIAAIPEDLDNPINQKEVDALIIYTGAIHERARRFLRLASKMMVGSKVQLRLIEKENEFEPGTRDMYDETGHTRADF